MVPVLCLYDNRKWAFLETALRGGCGFQKMYDCERIGFIVLQQQEMPETGHFLVYFACYWVLDALNYFCLENTHHYKQQVDTE